MKPLILAGLALMLTAQAGAQLAEAPITSPQGVQLSATAAAYMKSNGFDLTSAKSRTEIGVALDAPPLSSSVRGDREEYSLELLVEKKRPLGLRAFIGTRNFIKRLYEDYANTSIPTSNYDPIYLTDDESGRVGQKYADRYKKK